MPEKGQNAVSRREHEYLKEQNFADTHCYNIGKALPPPADTGLSKPWAFSALVILHSLRMLTAAESIRFPNRCLSPIFVQPLLFCSRFS
jgi:hypothetical protein